MGLVLHNRRIRVIIRVRDGARVRVRARGKVRYLTWSWHVRSAASPAQHR